MKRSLLAISVATLGIMAATASLPARADSGDITLKMFWEMADKDKNTMVTKQEFLDAMSKAYDMKMQKMKAAKDTSMMKGDAMTKEGVYSLIKDLSSGG